MNFSADRTVWGYKKLPEQHVIFFLRAMGEGRWTMEDMRKNWTHLRGSDGFHTTSKYQYMFSWS